MFLIGIGEVSILLSVYLFNAYSDPLGSLDITTAIIENHFAPPK